MLRGISESSSPCLTKFDQTSWICSFGSQFVVMHSCYFFLLLDIFLVTICSGYLFHVWFLLIRIDNDGNYLIVTWESQTLLSPLSCVYTCTICVLIFFCENRYEKNNNHVSVDYISRESWFMHFGLEQFSYESYYIYWSKI